MAGRPARGGPSWPQGGNCQQGARLTVSAVVSDEVRVSWPAYLSLGAGEGRRPRRGGAGAAGAGPVQGLPAAVQRSAGSPISAAWAIGRQAVVASHFPHFGEENCLRGTNGSGTIFSGCNLRCVFCQNFGISWQLHGEPVTPARRAAMMLELQDRGCHNINLVTPEHVVPQILQCCGSDRHMPR